MPLRSGVLARIKSPWSGSFACGLSMQYIFYMWICEMEYCASWDPTAVSHDQRKHCGLEQAKTQLQPGSSS